MNTDIVLTSGTIGTAVKRITGKTVDAAQAAGYTAFIMSITGTAPNVRNNGDGTATMYLTESQTKSFQKWLDKQVYSSLQKKEPASLRLNFKPVVGPWALKYALPVIAVSFIAGVISTRIAQRIF